MSFADRVAVITGASSGIGRELAKVLAAQGCKVGLMARREDQLAELASEIEKAGGRAACAKADVVDRQQVHDGIAALRAVLGPSTS